MTTTSRRAKLADYLSDLRADMAKAGKFTATDTDHVRAAALALLNGSGAMFMAMMEDAKHFAGEKASFVESMVTGMAANAAEQATRAVARKGVSIIADVFSGAKKKSEARKTGDSFKRLADSLGGKR